MSSDVCKHCTHAGCLDVCPTGALFRTEFGTVVVQPDICNGCGYCVSGCPYGVIERREGDGRAWKCTLCYDRLKDGLEPACAQACPTKSIQFGDLDELRERAAARVEQLHEQGVTEARLYGADPDDGVGGNGAFFLLLDEPEVYGFPPDPVVPTRDLPSHVDVRRAGRRRARRRGRRGVRGPGVSRRSDGRARPAQATTGRARPARRRWTRPRRRALGPLVRADGSREQPMVPRGRVPLLLRAADPEDAGLGGQDRLLLLRRRAVRRVRAARGRGRPDRPAGAAPRRPGRRLSPRWPPEPTSSSPTSAGRSGSTTCSGWPSRPRR